MRSMNDGFAIGELELERNERNTDRQTDGREGGRESGARGIPQ